MSPAVPHAPETPAALGRREVLTAMSGLLLAMFVSILANTIVANALPTIVADLRGDQMGYTWVVTATLLATTAVTPIWGKLADLFSKKLLVQIAIVIFLVGSIGAGFAHTMGVLIAWRFVQGIGAGGLQALTQVVIAALIPPRERGRFAGYTGSVLAAATVSGPLIGGLLVHTPALGWRWCFFVGVPVALVALIVLQRTLTVPTLPREVHLDYWGATLITGGVSVLLVWVSLAGEQFPWVSPISFTLVGIGLAALALALFVEMRVPEPVVPMWLLRDRTVVLSVVGSIVVGCVMFGGSVFLGQYFQIGRGYDPTAAGLLTLPLIGGMLLGTTGGGQLISRFGRWKPYLVAGGILLTGGLALMATVDHTTSVPLIGVYLVVIGLGLGLTIQNFLLAVQNTVDITDIGAASALVAFLRAMGGTVGVTVLGVLLDNRVSAAMADPGTDLSDLPSLGPAEATVLRAAYGDGIGTVFGVTAIASLLTLAAVLLIREVPLRTTIARAPSTPLAVDAPDSPVVDGPLVEPPDRNRAPAA